MNDGTKYEQMINYLLSVIYQQTQAITTSSADVGVERAKTVRFLALAVAALMQYKDYWADERAPGPDAEQQETADNGSEEEE